MQLLTFGSRELKPNDQLHVNWKLASRAGCSARFHFSQVLPKKFNFRQQGGIFLWLTNIDLGHQSYFFSFFFFFLHKVSANHITYHTNGLCGAEQKV